MALRSLVGILERLELSAASILSWSLFFLSLSESISEEIASTSASCFSLSGLSSCLIFRVVLCLCKLLDDDEKKGSSIMDPKEEVF